MGFDIECIIDIHTYPGEYFCPVCRTLVYPNEALQSQCTHLYCKPCLAHVANNTRACPYDGYLVTEADSKPLIESDKVLAGNIGKVKVRCLYHRSGCTWEGPLSECTSHCSGCTFGNSPVICNRCGVQIVHRQVHDHAQNCPGVYQVQQTAEAAQNAASSGPMVATTGVNQNQATVQSGVSSSQAQNSQTASAPVLQQAQDSNQQTNASSQAPAAIPTPEQWYQQQYQQYYQQYAAYDLYQQAYQQYYPYQQSVVQQTQQHPAAHGGQAQLQVYSQAPVQAQMQPQSQSQVHVMPHSQSQSQQLVQPQAQVVQPQVGQPQAQVQQGFSQHVAHVQSLNPQTQNQPQVIHQQPHPSIQAHAQIPLQSSLPHGFPAPQSQVHLIQPQAQHVQVPQYQQHPQPSQVHLQPHLPTQPQLQTQPHSQNQQPPHHTPHPQVRPLQPNQSTALNMQVQPIHPSANAVSGHQSYPQPQPLQQAQMGVPQQHPVHAQSTSGSLAPGQLYGQTPQQPALFVPPLSHASQQATFPSQGQLPSMPAAQQLQFQPQAPQATHSVQQRPLPQPYVQQQPLPGVVPSQLHQQGHLAMQQSVPSQLRPQGAPHVMQPNAQSHLHLQQNVAMVPVLQPQQTHNYVGRPAIPTHGVPGQAMAPFPQTSGGFGSAAQAKPAMLGSNQPSLNQNYANTVNNQVQTASDHPGTYLRHSDPVSEVKPVVHEGGLPSHSSVEKVANTSRPDTDGLRALKSEPSMTYEQELKGATSGQSRQNEPLAMDGGSELRGGIEASGGPLNELKREKEESNTYSLDPPANSKSVKLMNQKDTNGDAHDEELESQKIHKALLKSGDENLLPPHAASPSSVSKPDGYKRVNPEGSQQISVGARDQLQLHNHEQQMHHYGPSNNQQNPAGAQTWQSVQPRTEVPGHQPTQARAQGPGLQLQPRDPLNSSEQLQPPLLKHPTDVPIGGLAATSSMSSFGGGPGYFGASHGLPSAAVERDGIMGRAPQHGSEGQFGPPHFSNPVEGEMVQSQRLTRFDGGQSNFPGTFGRGPFGPPPSGEPSSFRMDGGPGLDSSLRPQDERFKTLPRDHLKPLSKDTPWLLDQETGSRALDRPPHGSSYDSGLKMGSIPGGLPPRGLHPFNPPGDPHFRDAQERGKMELDYTRADFGGSGRDYPGRPPHGFGGSSSALHGRDEIDGREIRSFGEGPRSYNLPSDMLGNSFHESRFPPLPSFQRRGELDGPESLRFVEHVPPGLPHNHLRQGDPFGQDIPPSHFRRGELGPANSPSHLRLGEPTNFGPFPGHARMGELSGPGNLPPNLRFGESFMGNKPRRGDPGFRSSFSRGYPNDRPYAGGMDPYDNTSRKRKPVSMGWCRICKVDCETVEGLDVHSQSREHQKITMDIVMSIKQHNRKKPRVSSDRAVREETNKTRNTGGEGRGVKPRDPVA